MYKEMDNRIVKIRIENKFQRFNRNFREDREQGE